MAHRATELADLINAIAAHGVRMLSDHDAACDDRRTGDHCRHCPPPWLLRQVTEVNSLAYDLVMSDDFDHFDKAAIVRNVLELRYLGTAPGDAGMPGAH